MEVLLVQDFPKLGFIGDQVSVKNGYARNYLIPRGIVLEASSKNANELKHRMAMVAARKAKKKAEALELLARIEQESLEFTLKFAGEGKSFGSVAAHDIEASLLAKGFTIDRKQLVLAEPIRSAGDFEVSIKLHSEVVAKLAIKVKAAQVAEPKKDKVRKPRHVKTEELESVESEEVSEEIDESLEN